MNYDLIVIGSGPGGYVAAIRASQLGMNVAVVERAELGGICLNWGCIPTKSLLKSAQVLEYARHAADYGVKVEAAEPDFAAVVARSRAVADKMSKGIQYLFKKNNITVIPGTGKLTADNAQYTVGFYRTSAASLADATPENTVRLNDGASINGQNFDREFAVRLYVPDIKNYLFVQKIAEDGYTPLSGAEFALYKASDVTDGDMCITSMITTSTRADYGIVTSAGRFVLAHAVELPHITATAPLDLSAGIDARELVSSTASTEPVDGERVIAVVALLKDGEDAAPLALGTRGGVVKRWNRESPTTMDSWGVIDLKDGDELLAAREAPDGSRLVFVSTDSSLLTFDAKQVRPQGRTAGGMAGIRLAEGCEVLAFAVVHEDELAWTAEETREDGTTSPAHGAVVLTVAGDGAWAPTPDRRRSRRSRCIRRRGAAPAACVRSGSSRDRTR